MAFVRTIAPKKFLYCIKLRIGALVIGVLMLIVAIICVLASAVVTASIGNVGVGERNMLWRNTFSFNLATCLFCCIMIAINLWFIWGVFYKRSSVVLSWVVITGLWLLQMLCLLLVMIIVYKTVVGLTEWIFALIFGLLFIGILSYGVLVVLGYWVQLRDIRRQNYVVSG